MSAMMTVFRHDATNGKYQQKMGGQIEAYPLHDGGHVGDVTKWATSRSLD
jgi:hypothetical protein